MYILFSVIMVHLCYTCDMLYMCDVLCCQCPVGYRDGPTDNRVPWPHGRRDEPLPLSRHAQHIRVRRLWCLRQGINSNHYMYLLSSMSLGSRPGINWYIAMILLGQGLESTGTLLWYRGVKENSDVEEKIIVFLFILKKNVLIFSCSSWSTVAYLELIFGCFCLRKLGFNKSL